jgi:hypothetical protein
MKTVPGNGKFKKIAVYEVSGTKTKTPQEDFIGRYESGSNVIVEFDREAYCRWEARQDCKIQQKIKWLARNYSRDCEQDKPPAQADPSTP